MKDSRLRTLLSLLFNPKSIVLIKDHLIDIEIANNLHQDSSIDVQLFNKNFDVINIMAKIEVVNTDLNDIICLTSSRVPFLYNRISCTKYKKISEYIIIPSLHNPRWIIPANTSDLGRMIRPSSIKAKIAIKLYKILSFIHLGILIFPDRLFHFSYSDKKKDIAIHKICSKLPVKVSHGAIYLGSFGPLQKLTVEYANDKNIEFYSKISDNNRTEKLLINEKDSIKIINNFSLKKVIIPNLVDFYSLEEFGFNVLVQTALKGFSKTNNISRAVAEGITEIYLKSYKNDIKSMDSYVDILINSINNKDKDILNKVQKVALLVIEEECKRIRQTSSIDLSLMSFSHGDFTRWNILEDEKHIYVFDWEEGKYRSIGYDIFHFILVEHILVENISDPKHYYNTIYKLLVIDKYLLEGIFFKNERLMLYYLKLYILDVMNIYLWHATIHHEESYANKENIDLILKFLTNLVLYVRKVKYAN